MAAFGRLQPLTQQPVSERYQCERPLDVTAETSSRDHFKFRTTGELIQNGARDIVFLTRITEETTMLRYIAGLIGAAAAMVAFRLLGMLDFSVRFLIFIAVYLTVTIIVDKAMARYGKKDS